jgi:CelD/BcsL family acetyltransferase involved in cellulose biosynthesis
VKEIRMLEEADDLRLSEFLAGSLQATVYHTPEWRNTLADTYGYTPLYLGCVDAGRLTGVLPMMEVSSWLTGKRLVSLPFSNVCGPIGDPEASEGLLAEAIDLYQRRGDSAIEIRTQADINPVGLDILKGVSYFITSIVDLDPDPDVVWKRFKDRNVRTEVRQAGKKGIRVRSGDSENDLKTFYSLYAPSRQGHGVPPQPYDFFRNLWRHLRPKRLDLFMAMHEDRCVGGLITLAFGKTFCAAYIGGDPAYRSYRVHQILFWKAMEEGCLRGYERFDFLRTAKKSKKLRYFKERWNAREVDLSYLYHPEIRGTASTIEETAKYRLLTAVLKRSPAFVGKAFGRMLYRHLG